MNISRLEEKIIIVSEEIGVSVYDFNFDLYFHTNHPFRFTNEENCILRKGAIRDYSKTYEEMLQQGLRLINSPDEYSRATELEEWYPLLKDLTPRSIVYETLPTADTIEREFGWPVFIKGSRQTSKHNALLSVAKTVEEYQRIKSLYIQDEILHWQKPVVREFIPLKKVEGQVPHQVSPSVEYRSFWWHGECVGHGRYWYQVPKYSVDDIDKGLDVAKEAARRMKVPFLVIDIAKTEEGGWIVIECNDGQESGYADIDPQIMWKEILKRIP